MVYFLRQIIEERGLEMPIYVDSPWPAGRPISTDDIARSLMRRPGSWSESRAGSSITRSFTTRGCR